MILKNIWKISKSAMKGPFLANCTSLVANSLPFIAVC